MLYNLFEKELFDSIPLLPKELADTAVKYKGAFRFWIGKFMYLTTQTRFELGFAVQRLSEYNNRYDGQMPYDLLERKIILFFAFAVTIEVV